MKDIWHGTSGPRDAKIMIVGEGWGNDEEQKQLPFVGMSGQELTKMLAEAGIPRASCFLTNVVPARPYEGEMHRFFYKTKEAKKMKLQPIKGLYPKEIIFDGVNNLMAQIKAVQPSLIIALGNYAVWALTADAFSIKNVSDKYSPEGGWKAPTGITSWRGSQLTGPQGIPLLPTYHPTAIMSKWDWRPVVVHDLRARVPLALNGKWNPPNYSFCIQPSFTASMAVLEYLLERCNKEPTVIAEDLETASGHISCVGFAWSRLDAICIPFWSKRLNATYWSVEEETALILKIRELHQHPNCRLVGQNFLYDAQYEALFWGHIPRVHLDTMVIHHLCMPGTPRGLDYLSSLYCEYHRFWKNEGKSWHPTFDDHQHWTYNCKDAVTTWEVAGELETVVDAYKLREQRNFQMEQWHLALDMMLNGVAIDLERRTRLFQELLEAEKKIDEFLDAAFPKELIPPVKKGSAKWYKSPKQLANILYEVINVPHRKKQGTDDEDLQEVMGFEPVLRPVLEAILGYRSVRKFRNDFIGARLDPDNRMRCSFDVAGTKTFRWSSSQNAFDNGLNLQTIPKGTED